MLVVLYFRVQTNREIMITHQTRVMLRYIGARIGINKPKGTFVVTLELTLN
jgi:hypothetical protein